MNIPIRIASWTTFGVFWAIVSVIATALAGQEFSMFWFIYLLPAAIRTLVFALGGLQGRPRTTPFIIALTGWILAVPIFIYLSILYPITF